MKNFEIIIVGSGAVGLSIANQLTTQKSLKIAQVSPRKGVGVASLAAGAMIDAFGEIETLDSQEEQDKLRYEIKAQRLYKEWLEAIENRSGSSVFHRQGMFIVSNNGGEYDIPKMNLMREQMKAYGEEFEEVDPKSIPGLKPNYLFRAESAMFIKNTLCVDTTELLPALEVAAEKSKGYTRFDDSVTQVTPKGDLWEVSTKNSGTLTAQKVVLCAGAHSLRLVTEPVRIKAGLPKLYFGRGASVTVINGPEMPYILRTPNRALSCGIHMVPRAGNRIYIGATNLFSTEYDNLPTGASCGEIHTLFEAIMNELNTSLRNVSVDYISWGLRPMSQYNFPLVGQTELPGLFVATGTHRTGVHLSPVIAEIAAAEILEQELSEENLFSPLKKSESPSEVDIAVGIRSLIATALFPNGRLPYNRMIELETFMTEIFKIAVGNGEQSQMRDRLRQILEDVPLDEQGVLRAYHEILEQRIPEDGPFPT
ncbi:MAG: FAD-binding oxidoreductase [Cyanobacteria bacterium P01_D01_bin.50]